jgi:oligopeptide transport system substrate-binding protein
MRGIPRASWMGGVATLALLATACGGGGGESGGEAPAGGEFSVSIVEPQELIPSNSSETAGSQVLAALFRGLVRYNIDSNEPELDHAESIESPDNTVWTVKLKPGWTFHDGTPVTADSYIDAWNYAALNKNAQKNGYFFGPGNLDIVGFADLNPPDPDPKDDVVPPAKADKMSGLKKVSDTEFTATLSQPYAGFVATLGYTAFYPLPKVAFADIKKFQEAPVGNGPFQMDGTWVHNQRIKVKKFPGFKGEQPKADAVTFKIYQKLETSYNDLLSNDLDITDSVPPAQIASAKQQLGDRYIEDDSSSFTFLGFPTYDPKYAKKEVRQAISLAIDRDQITKVIFNGTRTPATSFVNPIVPGYRDDVCGEFCKFNPEKAKQLLTQAGGLPGNAMTITYNADGGHKDWVEAVCNQITKNLTIKCTAVSRPSFDLLLDDLDKAKGKKVSFGPFRLGWVMDYPLMQNYLGPLYSTTGGNNRYGYSNPQFDKLVAEGNAAADLESAITKWQQAEDILAADFPVIPLWNAKVVGAYSENVKNVKIDAFDRVDLVNVEIVG